MRRARLWCPPSLLRRPGVEVKLVGVDGMQVTGGHGITVAADAALEEIPPAEVEMLVLPGGLGGVEAIAGSLRAQSLIQRCSDRGCWLAAICAAPYHSAANMGILDRRQAVCYPGMEEEMGSAVVQKGACVVVDGHIITGQAAGLCLCLRPGPGGTALQGPGAAGKVRDAVHYRRLKSRPCAEPWPGLCPGHVPPGPA